LVVSDDSCPVFFIFNEASNGWALARYKNQPKFNPFYIPPSDRHCKHGETVWSSSFNLDPELWPGYPQTDLGKNSTWTLV